MERGSHQLDLLFWQVGDKVTLVKDIWEDGNDHSPAGYYGRKGDTVIIKRLFTKEEFAKYPDRYRMPYAVAHEWVTDDRTFLVKPTEI